MRSNRYLVTTTNYYEEQIESDEFDSLEAALSHITEGVNRNVNQSSESSNDVENYVLYERIDLDFNVAVKVAA